MTKQDDFIRRKQRYNERVVIPFQEQQAAVGELRALWLQWEEAGKEEQRPARASGRVDKEVNRIIKEIYTGKTERIAERFAEAVERVRVSTLPKKKVTYLKMMAALSELVELNRAWQQVTPRTKAEHDTMLRHLRNLLLEVEAGYIEDIKERFRAISSTETS